MARKKAEPITVSFCRQLAEPDDGGGEATFYPSLPNLIHRAKTMGYKTKLDTNGTNPVMLRQLVEGGELDAVALDYKCPPHLADKITRAAPYVPAFQESLSNLRD